MRGWKKYEVGRSIILMKKIKFGLDIAVIIFVIIGLSGCLTDNEVSSSVRSEEKFQWKLVTAWPPNLPINHDTVEKFAEDVATMSQGRLKITVYAGGELIPALQTFDAVSQGSVEMGHGAAYYWAGKIPEAQFFSTVPFGMTQNGAWAWIYGGDGLDLWQELYKPFGVVPFPLGNTGIQMGGWFNKKIEKIDDLKGLKMRIPGLGGKVLAKAGGNPVLYDASEVYSALERGVIDATEWVGPLHDVRMGLDRAAKYYYFPGWHEPGTQLELIINEEAWNSLPEDLKVIVKAAAASASLYMFGQSEVLNAEAFNLLKEKQHVEILEFPPQVLSYLSGFTEEVMLEEASNNEKFDKVLKSYQKFRDKRKNFEQVTDRAYKKALEDR